MKSAYFVRIEQENKMQSFADIFTGCKVVFDIPYVWVQPVQIKLFTKYWGGEFFNERMQSLWWLCDLMCLHV